MEHPRFLYFIQIFILFSRYSSHSRYSLSNLCGNKRNHQAQAGGNADGNAETGGLSKPSDNRWSYQETEKLMLETMVMAMLALMVPSFPAML